MLAIAPDLATTLLCIAIGGPGWLWWRKRQKPAKSAAAPRHDSAGASTLPEPLIDMIPDAVVCMDGDGRWIAANQPAKTLFRLHEVDWHGKTARELATSLPETELLLACCLPPDEPAASTKKTGLPLETVKAHHSLADHEVRKIPIFNAAGQRELLVAVIQATDMESTEDAQRDTLVREVHHRIKNNLQGITGVLRLFAENHPETAQPITEAISQVQSISIIHGLKMNVGLQPLHLCGLVNAIAANNQVLWKAQIPFGTPSCKTDDCQLPGSENCRLPVNEAEAVPLALVLNELITNAIKHGNQFEHRGAQLAVELNHDPSCQQTQILISNHGQLPLDFDFENRIGTGTGLQLVATLLPRKGASLTWQQQGNLVVTALHLTQPVICAKQST